MLNNQIKDEIMLNALQTDLAGHLFATVMTTVSIDLYNFNREQGWYSDPKTGDFIDRNIPEMLCLVHSEISEGLEGYRKQLMDDKLKHRTMLEVELADAVIRIMDIAGYLGMDLGGAIDEKWRYNAKRTDHKLSERKKSGGKAF